MKSTHTINSCQNKLFRFLVDFNSLLSKRLVQSEKVPQHNLHKYEAKEKNKSCRRTASSPAGYILYCNIFIIKPYNIGHTDLDVFVCKSFCHLDIIIQV